MKYRLLGNSGLRVSEAALGTMTFGDDWGWGAAKEESKKVYDTFREVGGNFIDTANLYTNGSSESFLGEFMQGHRQSIVLATKYTNAMPGADPNAAGNHRKSMMQAVEASLQRLRTDYIDLYWVHVWDQMTPAEEVMRGLDDLVRQGKRNGDGGGDIARVLGERGEIFRRHRAVAEAKQRGALHQNVVEALFIRPTGRGALVGYFVDPGENGLRAGDGVRPHERRVELAVIPELCLVAHHHFALAGLEHRTERQQVFVIADAHLAKLQRKRRRL
jgi:aryl-alcohol dehydrogenase-like predicted oxidoreductase